MLSENTPLSISIVTYKTDPAMLNKTLASIANSTMAARTCVIDNSPTDELRSAVGKYQFTYIHTGKNIGFGRGHNLALKMIGNSKYHLILNPDISFGPSVLDDLHGFLEINPEIGWVMPEILYPDGSRQNLCKRLPSPWNLFSRRFLMNYGFGSRLETQAQFECRDLDLTKPQLVPYLSGCFAFVRTNLIQAVGGFDERFFMYLEDTDLVRRVGEHALTVFYPYINVYHVHGRGSYRSLKLLAHHLLSTVQYFCKWGWFIDRKRSHINRLTGAHARNIAIPSEVGDWVIN